MQITKESGPRLLFYNFKMIQQALALLKNIDNLEGNIKMETLQREMLMTTFVRGKAQSAAKFKALKDQIQALVQVQAIPRA